MSELRACGGVLEHTVGSLPYVQTDVLPPVCGRADYTKNVCFLTHDVSPFIDSECRICWI